MQAPSPSSYSKTKLARQARERWVARLKAGLSQIDQAVGDFLTALMEQTGTQRDMQKRRDAWQLFGQKRNGWLDALRLSFAESVPSAAASPAPSSLLSLQEGRLDKLELLGEEVVENKIIASRIALTAMEEVAPAFDALRLRMRSLGEPELSATDLFRPETVSLLLVESWLKVQLPRDDLQLCIEPLQRAVTAVMQTGYEECNRFLADQGVSAEREMRVRVRAPSADPGGAARSSAQRSVGGFASQALEQSRHALQSGRSMGAPMGGAMHRPAGSGSSSYAHSGGYSAGGRGASSGGYASGGSGGFEATPLVRARSRAQGVMMQLRRLLVPAIGADVMEHAPPASAALAHALAAHRVQADTYYSTVGAFVEEYTPATVLQVAGNVRERSAELKQKAETDGEKAIIEVVALMFQSILAEDRIAPAVRVWFARLQVPVLRVALAEPEFFSNVNHPARKLIDRMGAVALGFDAAAISGGALETEVRRIVQVIEQYPETGRRVFQLVHDEFEKFLSKHLTEKHGTAKLVSVAQQVEQKETLAIKYTIELRTMLNDMPVRDEVREFLFKVWAEVLALSAVRNGSQHPETVSFRRTAADLVWAASAKPNRSERAQVIQSLPAILQRLREGLAMLGVVGDAQDTQIKVLTDTLAEAFLSKTAPIPLEHIEAMARRLANVEEFLGDAVLGELPLDAEHIEMMTGIDAHALQVIADNGAPVEEAMMAWAQQLPLGNWFTLDHNGSTAHVQYAWHSERKQLHLFVANDGMSYLIQMRRLAAYLQSGLLVAREEDGLTVRATRDAIAKLDANPERLLG